MIATATDIASSPALFAPGMVAAIIAIVQCAKQAGMPSKYGGLASLAVGIVCGIIVGIPMHAIAAAIVYGLVSGLSASGLYSGAKAIAGK